MRLLWLAAAAALTITAAGTASGRPRRAQLPVRCTTPTVLLKTLSDRDRKRVRLSMRRTTISSLASLRTPHPVPLRRTTFFQRQTWEVIAQIVQFRLTPDGEIELVLYDGGSYVRAGMPDPHCLSVRSRARRTLAATRARFLTTCGRPDGTLQDLGAVAYVDGVGFWTSHPDAREAAANGAELQPVTSLRLIAGCR